MEKKVAFVLALILLVSVLVSAHEEPTIGQRIDSAATDATSYFDKHARPVVDTIKSIYNWFGDRARAMGL